MNKIYSGSIFVLVLIGCNNAPSCSEDKVLSSVVEINTIKKETNMPNLRRTIYDEIYPNNPIYLSEYNFSPTSGFGKEIEKYNELWDFVDEYIAGNSEKIPKEFLPIIEKYCSDMNPIYIPKVKNIRIAEQNKELESCGCNADLEYEKDTRLNKSIYYTAQKNAEDEIYVEAFNNN